MIRIERIGHRVRGLHPDHLRIARSAVWVSLFVLMGKSAGAFKEMAIAYRYGVGPVVDAYQLTFTLVTWLPGTAVTVLSAVLIPALVRLRKHVKIEQESFIGELQAWALCLGVLFAGLLYVCWSPALRLMGGRLSLQTLQMSQALMVGMLPIGMLMLLISIQAARLQSRERHVNTLLECVPAGTLLVATLMFGQGHSIAPLVFGTSVGFVFQSIWLSVLARRVDRIHPQIRLSFKSPEWPSIWRSAGIFMLGQIAMSCVTPLDQYFVAHLGDGVIGTLGYANRVLALILGMGALAVSRATLPVFSDIRSKGDHRRARDFALKWSGLMFLAALCAVLPAGIFAEHAIATLFQHGAFTSQNTAAVAQLFRWGLVQVPFYFSVLVMVQLLASQERFKVMAIIAILNFAVKAVANVWLVKWLDVRGIMLATALMHASSMMCYLVVSLKPTQDELKNR
ncbi:murein biosynthesis integral membrane protein MurJ [Paraburkholderia xenovorans]